MARRERRADRRGGHRRRIPCARRADSGRRLPEPVPERRLVEGRAGGEGPGRRQRVAPPGLQHRARAQRRRRAALQAGAAHHDADRPHGAEPAREPAPPAGVPAAGRHHREAGAEEPEPVPRLPRPGAAHPLRRAAAAGRRRRRRAPSRGEGRRLHGPPHEARARREGEAALHRLGLRRAHEDQPAADPRPHARLPQVRRPGPCRREEAARAHSAAIAAAGAILRACADAGSLGVACGLVPRRASPSRAACASSASTS